MGAITLRENVEVDVQASVDVEEDTLMDALRGAEMAEHFDPEYVEHVGDVEVSRVGFRVDGDGTVVARLWSSDVTVGTQLGNSEPVVFDGGEVALVVKPM